MALAGVKGLAARRRVGGRALARPAPRRACAAPAAAAQANLFSRLGRVVKSYTNAALSAAEDPEKMLDQTVAEMQEDLIKMRQASAQVMASQKQLEAKYKAAQDSADDWYRRAQLALEKNDEELAREALKRKKSAQENADSMKTQLASQTDAVDKLISNTRILEQKLAEAKSKKDTLKARAQSAKTQQQVSEMVGSLGTSNAYAAFDRMEEKVLQMEAKSEAIAELAAGSSGGDSSLDARFAALEGDSVDDELAKMKNKLGKGSDPAGQLPERSVADAIDTELEELRRKSKGN